MPLDANPQYYALDPADAGAQPAAAPDLSTDPDLTGTDPDLTSTDPDLSGPIMAAPAPAVPTLPAIAALIQQLSAQPPGNGKDASKDTSKSAPLVPMAGSTAKLASTLSPVVQAAAAQLMADPSVNPSPQLSPSPQFAAAAPPAVVPAPSVTDAAGNSVPAAPAVPPSGPTPLTMPTMPQHNDTALKIIGALAALSGGSGGKVLGAYVDARNAHDVQAYNQQVQAYQQQQHDTQQQANANGLFLARLGKLDPATQENTVRNLTPVMMAAYGYNPAQVQSQFFDAAGKFKPVTTDESSQQGTVLRAQAAFRSLLSQDTADSQQATHDSFASHPDDWKTQTGTDYDSWKPFVTTKAVQGEEKITQAGQKVQQGQERVDQGQQKVDQGDRKLDQGDQQLNLNAQAIKNREGDAQRNADIRQLSQQQQARYQTQMTRLKAEGLNIQQAHNVAMEQIGRQNAATSRLRAVTAQSGGSGGSPGIRALQAQMKAVPTAASYQSAINTANTTKNHILANAHDKDGNQIPLTPFQQSVVESANNSILQAQHGQRALAQGINSITGQRIVPSGSYLMDPRTGRPAVAPDGSLVRPLPPMPISVPTGIQTAPRGPAMPHLRVQLGINPGRGIAPSAPPLPGNGNAVPRSGNALPALRAQMRQPVRTAAPKLLTPQQRAGLSNQDFARYLAQRVVTKLGGR